MTEIPFLYIYRQFKCKSTLLVFLTPVPPGFKFANSREILSEVKVRLFYFYEVFFHASTDSLILISYTEVFSHPKPVPSFSAAEIKTNILLYTIFSLI